MQWRALVACLTSCSLDVVVDGLEVERGQQRGLHLDVLIDGVRKVRFVMAGGVGFFHVGDVAGDDKDGLVHWFGWQCGG